MRPFCLAASTSLWAEARSGAIGFSTGLAYATASAAPPGEVTALAARLADAAVVLRRGRIAHRESGDPLDPKILENAYSAASNLAVS